MVKVVQKHFPKLEEMAKGHGRKTKVGLRSTKVQVNEDKKTIFMKLVNMEEKLHNKIFTDQTGAFPYRLSKGTG